MSRACTAAAALAFLAAVQGCASDYDNAYLVAVSDPATRHPIVVTAERPFLEIKVPKHGQHGLSPEQRFNVARFLRQYQTGAEGKLLVSLPRTKSAAREVALALEDIRHLAHRAGLSHGHVVVASHPVPAPSEALIHLSFHRIAAVAPECGDWSENIVRNREALPYPNFGCASQRNLAAMVANPTDLVLSAGETPRASERRSYAWKKYIEGTISETPKESNLPKATQN